MDDSNDPGAPSSRGPGSVEEASEEELGAILAYLAQRTETGRPPILLGGWAVYAFNPYSKSRDIDLVLSSDDRGSLTWWLGEKRGYEDRRQHVDGWRGAVKRVASLDKDIVVDIATYAESYPFEGREQTLDFDLALDHNVTKRIAGSRIPVPSRSLLTLYKLKAAWDRSQRLSRRGSPGRERAKLVKDRSDVLALTDDEHVQDAWELSFLRERFQRYPFLQPVLAEVWQDENARARYRGITAEEARRQIEGLLQVLGLTD